MRAGLLMLLALAGCAAQPPILRTIVVEPTTCRCQVTQPPCPASTSKVSQAAADRDDKIESLKGEVGRAKESVDRLKTLVEKSAAPAAR